MGRQPEQSISRFNVNTHISDNLKFPRLCRYLQCDEKKAYYLLVRFWNFVAKNRAMTGSIADVEAWEIARFCWWDDKDGDPEAFISALKKAGYVSDGKNYPDEPDGTVHDWFENQPMADECLRGRTRRKQAKDQTPKEDEKPSDRIVKEERRLMAFEQEHQETLIKFEERYNGIASANNFATISFFSKDSTSKARKRNFLLALQQGDFQPQVCLDKLESSQYLMGRTQECYKMSIDFLFQSKKGVVNYRRVQEGFYNRSQSSGESFQQW